MNREKLALFIKHHGLARTGLVYTLKAIRRLIDIDIMRVESSSGRATERIPDKPYVTRQIMADEYREGVQWLGEEHQRQWAFERGDRCFANVLDSKVIGYQFYARRSTIIRPGLAFGYPDTLTYAYASFTHLDHRGKRLAKSRANARRYADQAEGIQREVVWYISVDNLDSRSVSRQFHSRLLGYVAFLKIGRQYFCYASPRCKRAGIRLLSTPT